MHPLSWIGCWAGIHALAPKAYEPLPVGSVTPTGWLLHQLRLQRDGLSGHLALFWDDIADSVWIGGTADAGLAEKMPYWLNGIVPLAFLLMGDAQPMHSQDVQGSPLCAAGVNVPGPNIVPPYRVSTLEECWQGCTTSELKHQGAVCGGFVLDNCSAQHPMLCSLKNFTAAQRWTDPIGNNNSCLCGGNRCRRAGSSTAQSPLTR